MKNQKIKLRRLKASDSLEIATLANNKNVWDNLRDYLPHPYTEQDAEEFIRLTQHENPRCNFAITHNDTLCGVIGLILQKDVYKKSAELGYWIGEPFWGKGIATKAVALIVSYGFDELGLTRIFSGVFEYNKASMKVLEKNGFQKEGLFKKAVFKNEKFFDEHRYYKLHNQ